MRIFFDFMKPQLRKVYECSEDDLSKDVFTECLNVRFKVHEANRLYPYFDPNPYFSVTEMNLHEADCVFVDCGAYTGDSTERFINMCGGFFWKVYAFEPTERAQKSFLIRRKRLIEEWALEPLQIQLVPAGVGAKSRKASLIKNCKNGLTTNSVAFDVETAKATLQVSALDDLLSEENIRFIKADIEGSEMAMLRGASNIIRQKKPMLAISLYHRIPDYYEIPLYIKELVPDYHTES